MFVIRTDLVWQGFAFSPIRYRPSLHAMTVCLNAPPYSISLK